MKYAEFFNQFGRKAYKQYKFKNKHGEVYHVIKTKSLPAVWFITGDETDWDMLRLFHPDMDIYSKDELWEISNALRMLA